MPTFLKFFVITIFVIAAAEYARGYEQDGEPVARWEFDGMKRSMEFQIQQLKIKLDRSCA